MTNQRSVGDEDVRSDSDSEHTVTHQRGQTDLNTSASLLRPFLPGTVLAGRYRIVAPLGAGGGGEVYRAEDTRLGQTVALKFVTQRIADDPRHVERIVAEVRIGRQVAHPNLCRIYDMVKVGKQYFITMEYVDGENLASMLLRVGRLSEEKALEIAREICAGLAAAHDRGVVHRDVKPSNVMIDGRGHVRITDYGLSVIPGEVTSDTFAGTPAYMAPEQFEGIEATEQSDIYSLGLVLHEVFTGQRLFSGSLVDIAQTHRLPKRPPSTIARGLSPAIERVILQCIEEVASDRPESVRDVLRALPGDDSLRQLIASGETPSPRAISAASRVGELSLPMAWSAAAAMMLLLVAIIAASRYTMLYRQVPLNMSPDVLADRARQIIRSAGYEPRPPGSRAWMGIDLDALQEATGTTTAIDRSPAFRRISPLRFGYRESPQPLVPRGRGAIVNASDPPLDLAGMIMVTLDSHGQLVRFVRMPDLPAPPEQPARPPRLPQTTAYEQQTTAYDPLFALAGLDKTRFRLTPKRWTSPVDHEEKRMWIGMAAGDPPVPVEVRAALHSGKVTFFEAALQLHQAASVPRSVAAAATTTEEFTGVAGFAAIFLVAVVLAAFVARRNLRQGRGDRASARKVSLLVFSSLLVAGLLSADHTADPAAEWGLLVGIAGNALYHAAAIWLFYIAAEPYVRKRQPELLISWTRALKGYFRDPLVGRDVLIGCLLGALVNLCYAHLLVLLPTWVGMQSPLPDHSFPEKLGGGLWPLVSLAALVGSVPRDSVLALFLFSAIRSAFRSDWLAAALVILMSTIPHMGRDVASGAESFFVVCAAAIFVFALCRVGLLAGMAALFVGSWFAKSLFVFDPRSWLFGPSLFYLTVVLALVLYGLHVSVGAKPLLGRVRLAE